MHGFSRSRWASHQPLGLDTSGTGSSGWGPGSRCRWQGSGTLGSTALWTWLGASVHQVVIDDTYLQWGHAFQGAVRSWPKAHRAVACRPEATSCQLRFHGGSESEGTCLLLARCLAGAMHFLASCTPAACMRSPTKGATWFLMVFPLSTSPARHTLGDGWTK